MIIGFKTFERWIKCYSHPQATLSRCQRMTRHYPVSEKVAKIKSETQPLRHESGYLLALCRQIYERCHQLPFYPNFTFDVCTNSCKINYLWLSWYNFSPFDNESKNWNIFRNLCGSFCCVMVISEEQMNIYKCYVEQPERPHKETTTSNCDGRYLFDEIT